MDESEVGPYGRFICIFTIISLYDMEMIVKYITNQFKMDQCCHNFFLKKFQRAQFENSQGRNNKNYISTSNSKILFVSRKIAQKKGEAKGIVGAKNP